MHIPMSGKHCKRGQELVSKKKREALEVEKHQALFAFCLDFGLVFFVICNVNLRLETCMYIYLLPTSGALSS